MLPLKVTGREKRIEAVEIELGSVTGERGLSWFERRADEAGKVPLDRSGAGIFEVSPDETFAGFEDIFLVCIAMQGLSGQIKRFDLGRDGGKSAPQHGNVSGIDHLPGSDFVVIPESDFVQPLRDFRKGAQRPQRAGIASQLGMQLAEEGADFLGIRHVVAVMLDELPEGQSETIVLVRAGRHFFAGRDDGEIAGREISRNVQIELKPPLCRLANKRRCRSYASDNGGGYQMHQNIAAIGDNFGRVATTQAEIAGHGKGGSDGTSAEVVHREVGARPLRAADS